MTIFSRRTLQRLLNENSSFLTESQLKEHINRLNRVEAQSLDTEWEVVILNSFSKLGKIIHEPDFSSSSKKVDLLFESRLSEVKFIADIATVSTSGLDDDNPIWFLRKELSHHLRRFNLNPSHFSIDVGGKTKGEIGKQKMILKLPPKKDFNKYIFNSAFEQFLTVCSQVQTNNCFYINIDSDSDSIFIEITIKFTPGQEFVCFGYPSYDIPYSLSKNPIHNALDRKHKQLKTIDENILKGIILCNSNYNLFSNQSKGFESFSIDEIINHFMKHNQSIAFIVTFSAESYREYFYSPSQKYRIQHCVYINESINANNKDEKAEVVHLLNELIEYLPKPYKNGVNAFHRLSWLKNQHQKLRHQGESFYGGYTMSSKSIKFSLRGLQELLANRIKSEDFLKVHENYFLNQILSGKTIQDIIVHRCIDKDDDDWVEFEYTEADKNILFSLTDNLIQFDEDSLKMPLVSLQIILANLENIHNNKTSYNHFLDQLFKYFENKLFEGRLIQKIFVLNGFQVNTDWVEIEFGGKDAAISKFSFPKSI